MKVYERAQQSTLVQRLGERPERLIIIEGPRQIGKTTLVRQVLDQINRQFLHVSVDESDPTTFRTNLGRGGEATAVRERISVPFADPMATRWLVSHWEQARQKASRSERGFILAIDEIEKIPNWSEAVKGLWDADRRLGCPLHVVLICSVPLIMQKSLSESLAGRYEIIHLAHWSFAEMSAAFDFDLRQYIYFGGYPGAASLVCEQDRWRSYVLGSLIDPNFERDILAMQRVDKPLLFRRLLELCAGYSGKILSYDRMLDQLHDADNTTTLAHYLDLLSGAGLITGLSRYDPNAQWQWASSPKLNVLNTALMSSESGYRFEEALADQSFWGRLVESAVGAHLFNTKTPGTRLHFWRNSNHEVDFVLKRGPCLVAFEVKSGARRSSVSGLREFGDRFDVTDAMVVGEGGVAVEDFLTVPAGQWLDG